MVGKYLISDVDKHVKKNSIGAFILSRNGKNAHYVGRGDKDLLASIKQFSVQDKTYVYFWYDYTANAKEAYYLECQWYHAYLPVDNSNHPTSPPNETLRCPVKGCPWS